MVPNAALEKCNQQRRLAKSAQAEIWHPLVGSGQVGNDGASIVGIMPTMRTMRLFQSADVLVLTGLTKSQLREWTGRGRRELLHPDVEPDGPGRHALFSWQTVLVLRVLLVLHRDFAAEVGAWAPAAQQLRGRLEHLPFFNLWRLRAVFPSTTHVILTENIAEVGAGGIVVPLEPHLEALATQLSLPRPDQLPLFPTMAVTR